jgi:hypothetical protein
MKAKITTTMKAKITTTMKAKITTTMEMKITTTVKTNKKLLVLVCLLWTNILIVSSQGLYRQSQNPQSGSEKVTSAKEELSGFLFESKSALTEKPVLPGDVGSPVGDGCLILIALTGGYIVYRLVRIRTVRMSRSA